MADDDVNDKPENDDIPEPDDKPDDNKPDDDKKPSGDDDKADLGDAGKQALDRMKRERNAAQKALKDVNDKLKKYEDQGKSETQRLSEAAEEAKARASKSEQGLQKLQMAMDRAPEGATLKQIRAVAKRLSGDTDEELEADADELFALLAPAKEKAKPPPGKPRENLRGGGDPDEEPEEMDPRKLANLIGRP